MVDAWDFGIATGVAGWLLDSQTDRIVDELRRERAAQQPPPAPEPQPHPSTRIRGWPIDWSAQSLRPADTLERSRLAVTIAERLQSGRDLSLAASPKYRSHDSYPALNGLDPDELGFTVLVTQLDPAAPIVVSFEDRPRGFSGARLLPVFDGPGPPGRVYCRPDEPDMAVNVVEWGLEQFQLILEDFSWAMGH
jgi:hypothetical protein